MIEKKDIVITEKKIDGTVHVTASLEITAFITVAPELEMKKSVRDACEKQLRGAIHRRLYGNLVTELLELRESVLRNYQPRSFRPEQDDVFMRFSNIIGKMNEII